MGQGDRQAEERRRNILIQTQGTNYDNKNVNNKNTSNNNIPKKKQKTETPFKLKGIPCLYTNTDCLTNKMEELKLIIRDSTHTPMIIGITEVKPKNFKGGGQRGQNPRWVSN